MLIGELSRATGVAQRLLRYYEEQELLESRRDANGYRRYDGSAVTRVRQIRALLAAGLTTEVIARALPCASGDRAELELCPELVATLRRELLTMDERIDRMRRSRGALAAYLPPSG